MCLPLLPLQFMGVVSIVHTNGVLADGNLYLHFPLVHTSEVVFEALMKDLALLQHHVSRSELVQQRCLQDEEHYRGVREAIGASIRCCG